MIISLAWGQDPKLINLLHIFVEESLNFLKIRSLVFLLYKKVFEEKTSKVIMGLPSRVTYLISHCILLFLFILLCFIITNMLKHLYFILHVYWKIKHFDKSKFRSLTCLQKCLILNYQNKSLSELSKFNGATPSKWQKHKKIRSFSSPCKNQKPIKLNVSWKLV